MLVHHVIVLVSMCHPSNVVPPPPEWGRIPDDSKVRGQQTTDGRYPDRFSGSYANAALRYDLYGYRFQPWRGNK